MYTTTVLPPNIHCSSDPLLTKLAQYQMVPQLIREWIIDEETIGIALTEAERQTAIDSFCQHLQIATLEAQQTWLTHNRMNLVQLEAQAIRLQKLENFKQQRWGHQVETLFLAQKQQFDQVVYSLLRTHQAEVAQELFFRLQNQEQTFSELVKQYSQGAEVYTGGIIGPIEFSQLHPVLAQLLAQGRPGQLFPPRNIDQWIVIIRLEQNLPATLTPNLRQRLIDGQFEEWMQEKMSRFDVAKICPQNASA